MSEEKKSLEVLITKGNNKFIFIDSNDSQLVISKPYSWHRDIYNSIKDKFDEDNVVAGGFINLDEDSKTIKITGSSGSYGSMDLDLIKDLITPQFVGYAIETDMAEKRAYKAKVKKEKKERENEKNEFLQDFSTFKQAFMEIQSKYQDIIKAKDAIEEKRLRFINNSSYKKAYLSQIMKKSSLLSSEAQDAIILYLLNENLATIESNAKRGYFDLENFYLLRENLSVFKEGSTLKEELTLALVELYKTSKTSYTMGAWSKYDNSLSIIANLYGSIKDERFFETKFASIKEDYVFERYRDEYVKDEFEKIGFSKDEALDIMAENTFLSMQNYSSDKTNLQAWKNRAKFFLKNGREKIHDEILVNAIRNQIENPPKNRNKQISVYKTKDLEGLSEGALKEISTTYLLVLADKVNDFDKRFENNLETFFELFPEEIRQNMKTRLVENLIGSKHPSVIYSMMQSYSVGDTSLLTSLASDALEKEDVSSKYVLAQIYSRLGKEESKPLWEEVGLKSLTSNPVAAEEALRKANYSSKEISQIIGTKLISSVTGKNKFESTILGIDYLLRENILTDDLRSQVIQYASEQSFSKQLQLHILLGEDTKEIYIAWGDKLLDDSWRSNNFSESMEKYSLAGLNKEESVYRITGSISHSDDFNSSFLESFQKLNPTKDQWNALADKVVDLYENAENKKFFNTQESVEVLNKAGWNNGTKNQLNLLANFYEQNVSQNPCCKEYSNLHKAISLRRKAERQDLWRNKNV